MLALRYSMTTTSELEIKGNFLIHPFAEIAAEAAQGELHGSLRVADGNRKVIVYFRRGCIVFAVSNERSTRLFDILIRQNRLTRDDVVKIPNFGSDFDCAAFLTESGFMSKSDRNELFTEQVRSIIVDLIGWKNGEWCFTSLARIRDGLEFNIETEKLITDYARCLDAATIVKRFRSLDEVFDASEIEKSTTNLLQAERVVLSLIRGGELPLSEILERSPLSESNSLQSIYTLWMAGFAKRINWQPTFSEFTVQAIRGAHLELKREALRPVVKDIAVPKTVPAEKAEVSARPQIEISLEDYLTRVESASTFYDVLGVDALADLDSIKHAYFSLAKMFHPDHYYKQGGDVLKRVQNAFAELASAHEVLRNAESRELYDYKVRKELAEREKAGDANSYDERSRQLKQAAEEFERGFTMLMNNEAAASLPFLARAAHFDKTNPRYRAYYGKALSSDEKQRHKAEAEMQAAVKIDATNPSYRIMLAEFFIQMKLLKRAEGELNRLLAIYPSNREAQALLASLKA